MDPSKSKKTRNPSLKVGYGRPPDQHRFVKGVSGNPKGRPKKQQMSMEDFLTSDNSFRTAFEQLASQEVSVRAGQETLKMPAVVAVARAVMGQALQGNLRAAALTMNLFQDIQREKLEKREAQIEQVLTYKREAEAILAEHERKNEPEPELIPHPDDIDVNVETAEITVDGPLTVEGLRTLKELVDFMEHLTEEITFLKGTLKSEPDNALRQADLESHVRRFHAFNKRLPKRLKMHLPGDEPPRWPRLFNTPGKTSD